MGKDKTFDELMTDLNGIILELEDQNITLDDAIQKGEKALELVNLCRGRLETAKQKIEKLVQKADGSWTTEELEA